VNEVRTESDNARRSGIVAGWPGTRYSVGARTFAPAFILIVAAILNLVLLTRFPLAPDETYYWQWSRHLDLGYYDQGPLIAWWIRGSCLVFGDTAFGVRFGIVLAALATHLFAYLLARDLCGENIALLSLIPSILTPLALAGGFIATYDPLVVLFWAAAMYFASRALFFDSQRAWLGVGISFGLGLLSKHTMLLFIPCLLVFMLALPEYRRRILRPEPWLALLVAVIVFLPNLWWQTQHGWMTIRHLFLLTGKGLDQPFGRRLGDFVGSQVFLNSLLLFFLMVAAVWWTGRNGRKSGNERFWFIFSFSAPVLLLFLLMTVKSKVQANWAVCGWLTPPIALVAWIYDRPDNLQKRFFTLRNAYNVSIAFSVFLSSMLLWPELRAQLRIHIRPSWDQMNKLYGGAELANAADPLLQAMEKEVGGKVAVGAVTYDNASRLAFYMSEKPDTCCLFPGTRLNSYVLWNDRTLPKPGGSMLLADDYPPGEPRLSPFDKLFDRIECDGKPIYAFRPGVYTDPVHTFYLYRCYGYRPNPVIETPSGG